MVKILKVQKTIVDRSLRAYVTDLRSPRKGEVRGAVGAVPVFQYLAEQVVGVSLLQVGPDKVGGLLGF